jgi:aspartate racemase
MNGQSGRRVVGILGGMGPLATAAFHRSLVLATSAAGDQDHLHVLVDSDPSIPDRTAFLLGQGDDPRPAIARAARRLVDAGAEVLVMPCNTANVFRGDIELAAGVPVVPWLDIAVEAAVGHRSEPQVIGLLATTGSIRAGVFQRLLADRGVEVIVPDKEAQRDVMDAVYGPGGVKGAGRVGPPNRRRLLSAGARLTDRGAELLLLGCTELPLAVGADDPDWPAPAVDPATEVARYVVRAAGGTVASSFRADR